MGMGVMMRVIVRVCVPMHGVYLRCAGALAKTRDRTCVGARSGLAVSGRVETGRPPGNRNKHVLGPRSDGKPVPTFPERGLKGRVMTRFALQFGQTQPGLTYVERPTVYGVCGRGDKDLAVVRIGVSAPYEYDLPGGGIESDEDEAAALMREFEEETGLTVWPTSVIGRAGQFWINRGEPRNSLATFYDVELSADDGSPTEPDHTLVWMTPMDALSKMRHEAHAWAIMHWMRQRRSKK
ncbi:MAG: NUDIX domain-containing protein [Alphaproteobacteria bacterium]|nr:NUDIX domain-containing protein [Alphaproteobacteria bacterium]